MASSFNTMNDISKSIKLIKECQYLNIGSDYFIVDHVSNPTTIKIGHGFGEIKLKDTKNNEFILNGNLNKIGQLFKPNNLFEVVGGSSYILKTNIDTFQSKSEWKEFPTATLVEQFIDVGVGVSSKIFVEKSSNKVVKFVGNLNKINSLFEEIVIASVTPPPVLILEQQRPVRTKTITGPIGPVGLAGVQGEMGPTGIIGTPGTKGDTGEKGEKGDQGDKGDQGEIGPVGEIGPPGIQGIQGIQGPPGQDGNVGPQGDVGPQGLVGPQGIQGKPGSNGQNGKDGIQGAIGPQGPMGEKGDRGEKGEKGDRGQNGLQGIPGVAGTVGQKGDKGDKGDIGPIGISPVITAEYPVILKEGKISFDAQKLTALLDQFKNQDIQKAIDSFAKTATPGGGGLGILFLGSRVLKSVNDINFTGSGVTVIQRGKGVEVNISGGGGAGISGPYVASINGITGAVNLKALAGITSSISGNTYSFSVNYLSGGSAFTLVKNPVSSDVILLQKSILDGGNMYTTTLKGLGFITSGVDKKVSTISSEYIKLFTEVTVDDVTEKSISFSDFKTLLRGISFSYQLSSPAGATHGDRWMASDTGIEYIYINDGNTNQWVQPTNTSSNSTPVSILGTVGVTGATYTASVVDYYIGVSYAGPVTVTLPVAPETGREIVVKDESGNAGNGVSRQITIVGATASHKIDNQSSAIINLDNAALHFLYRNGWRII